MNGVWEAVIWTSERGRARQMPVTCRMVARCTHLSDSSLDDTSSGLVLLASVRDTLESLDLQSVERLAVVLGRDESLSPGRERLELLLECVGRLGREEVKDVEHELGHVDL